MRRVHGLVVGCLEKFFALGDPKFWIMRIGDMWLCGARAL
jgi:hypothetical protein